MKNRELFEQAIKIQDTEERAQFLAEACKDDPEQLRWITSLLKEEVPTGEFYLDRGLLSDLSPLTRQHSSEAKAEKDADLDLSFLSPTNIARCIGRLGHYEVVSVIGQGGFGTVLKAFDTQLHRAVAIKVMHPMLAASSPARKRFLREARSAAKISHENVVRIYAVDEQPIPFLVMEYIDGPSLQTKLKASGPLDLHELLHVACQIAHGIRAAHDFELIHRDIKPANIMLQKGPNQTVKLTDFGLARSKDDASITQSGAIAGTPLYMAPEQFHGEPIDPRTDQFSFGSVLYEIFCGHPPFRGKDTASVMHRICNDKPRSLTEHYPEAPRWLNRIIFKLLEKKKEDRFADMDQVCQVLDACKKDLEFGNDVESSLNKLVPNLFDSKQESTPQLEATRIPSSENAVSFPEHSRKHFGIHRWLVSLLMVAVGLALYFGYAWQNGLPKSSRSSVISEGSNTATQRPKLKEIPNKPLPSLSSGEELRAPLTLEDAQRAQKAWAKKLGVPVEYSNSIGVAMMLIPPGEFLMGMEPGEIQSFVNNPNYYEDQKHLARNSSTQHWVRITEPFYMSKYEISEKEFLLVLGPEPRFEVKLDQENGPIPKRGDSENMPATRLSWREAVQFCKQLSEAEGLPGFKTIYSSADLHQSGYRLATESEWEWASRSGASGLAALDNTVPPQGWFFSNAGGAVHPRGQLPGNLWGLYDMLGNVQEWCLDDFDSGAYETRASKELVSDNPLTLPSGLESTGNHIHRGGCIMFPAFMGSSGFRNYRPDNSGSWFTGFRIVKTIQSLNLNE